jgi:hypothetical protein
MRELLGLALYFVLPIVAGNAVLLLTRQWRATRIDSMSKGHHSGTQTGGTDRGKIRPDVGTDNRAEGAKAARIARESFAIEVPNRPNETNRETGRGR